MNAREKFKTLTCGGKMEVSNKLGQGASIQSVVNKYGVSRSSLYDIKKNFIDEYWNLW
jgi:transposase